MDEQASGDDREAWWAPHDHFPQAITSALRAEEARYEQGARRPLAGYSAILTAYAAGLAGLWRLGRRRSGRVRVRIAPGEVALATVTTAKLSRLLAKDPVTSPLRAPFTTFKGRSGEAELAEEVRGSGLRRALGELLTCPFCIGQWVATGFGAGFALAPDATRLVATVGAMIAGADALQYAFAGLQEGWKRISSD